MLIRVTLCTFISMFSVCFANEYNNELINEIIANDSSEITYQSDKKIYIDSERIYPSDQGYFIQLKDDQYFVTPFLYADSDGFYLSTSSIELAKLSTKLTKPCPHCGLERISGAFKCRNPNCPSNQPKSKNNK